MLQIVKLADWVFCEPSPSVVEGYVNFDGFDENEKRSALNSYFGRDSSAVLGVLSNEAAIEGYAGLVEDWSFLAPPAIRHFARAFVVYAATAVAEGADDAGEIVGRFLWSLWAILRSHGSSAFTEAQLQLLVEFCEQIGSAGHVPSFAEWSGEIEGSAKRIVQFLRIASVGA